MSQINCFGNLYDSPHIDLSPNQINLAQNGSVSLIDTQVMKSQTHEQDSTEWLKALKHGRA